MILSELRKRLGQELWQTFDLLAGTSTGGIIALGSARNSRADAEATCPALVEAV